MSMASRRSSKLVYIFPQKAKLIGVMNVAVQVLTAVILMDNSVFPLEKEDMKLEMFPPGQDATRIIPNAIIGGIQRYISRMSRKVIAGKPIHCRNNPVVMDLGLLKTSLNILGRRPRATPNIMKANTILIVWIPASLKLMVMAFRDCSC